MIYGPTLFMSKAIYP